MEANRYEYEELSRKIWEHPETAYKETFAFELQKEFLISKGFSIDETKGSVPNSLYAYCGHGRPVIAFLGEYDALPGMSQVADLPEKKPESLNGAGHGCGHNLLGTACVEAAVRTADTLKDQDMEGTVVYIGCPGEESGAGKAFMLRESYFDDIDYAFTWHPSSYSGMMRGTLANVRILFEFKGKSAHAAAAPWEGRSALDACELTNIGVNYLREHVRPEVRMHYAYLNSGGSAPNIVPEKAKLIYALRAPKDELLRELIDRVTDIAKGAALMTGTTLNFKVLTYYASVFGVPSMDQLVYSILEKKIPISYTAEELAYAKTFSPHDDEENMDLKLMGYNESGSAISTDAGNVSQCVPLGVFHMSTMTKNANLHTWMATAQGISSIAFKGMHEASEVMKEAALRIYESEELQAVITKEFRDRKVIYDSSLFPEDTTIGDVREILP